MVSKKGKGEKSDTVLDIFGVNDESARKIFGFIENKMEDEIPVAIILKNIMDDTQISDKERTFSIYATGFCGGRSIAISEISNIIGQDKFQYLLDTCKTTKAGDPMFG